MLLDSTKVTIETMHWCEELAHSRPLRHLGECVDILREALADKTATYDANLL